VDGDDKEGGEGVMKMTMNQMAEKLKGMMEPDVTDCGDSWPMFDGDAANCDNSNSKNVGK
jgi:hypothetical protein